MSFDVGEDSRKRLLELCELFDRGQVSAGVLALGLRNTTTGLDDDVVDKLSEWERDIDTIVRYTADHRQAFEIQQITRKIRKYLTPPV